VEGAHLGRRAVTGDELGVEFLEMLDGPPGADLFEEVNYLVAYATRLRDFTGIRQARRKPDRIERNVPGKVGRC